MTVQLALLEAPPDWRIDEHTKEVGRRGLARARAVLQSHPPADWPTTPPVDDVPRAA
ncbi:hypothetical protein [Candidatus Poriferisocius sp.]|uniref:hypothetical protein n=1 Tax=Candidatus Poriferisocius sp. TaxID=3101276 RepID=UPI003B01325A